MAIFQNLTIREIGEQAGVSTATVSRALNGTGPVSSTTMEKIQKAIEDLGYMTPGPKKTANTKIILVIFPDLINPFNGNIIKGINDVAYRRGYKVIYYSNENYTHSAPFDFLEEVDFYDGLILAHALPDQQRLAQLSAKKPIIMCSQHISGCTIPYVAIDDYDAACTAVKHLLATGRKKIACINSALSNSYAFQREQGYRACLEKAGLPIREEWILHLPSVDFDSAFGSLHSLFNGKDHPDAFFCVSDVYAASVIKYVKSQGLRVPQDVSVMGFDDIPQAIMMTPAISTIHQPAYQMGYQACNLLIEQIENPSMIPTKIILNTDLIVRGST